MTSSVILSPPVAHSSSSTILFAKHGTISATSGSLGPASAHYRSYRCLVQDTNSVRISDSIILFPAPLVVPGASRFDQLLALTERISVVAETTDVPDARAQLFEALALLKTFLATRQTNHAHALFILVIDNYCCATPSSRKPS